MSTDIANVVENGYCVGCGACGVASDGRISLTLRTRGYYEARLEDVSQADLEAGTRVCPFAQNVADEDRLAAERFPDAPFENPQLGRFISVKAGRVVDQDYLLGSSSGGMTSWVASELMRREMVDGVIAMGPTTDRLFGYSLSLTVEEVRSKRKSMYYASNMAEALQSVRGDGKKYAIVGVPCFIKAARTLAREYPDLAAQYGFYLGLVCGHLKSAAFAELEAWQLGIQPADVDTVDFRVKNPRAKVGEYSFGARSRGEKTLRTRPSRSLVGSNWGHAIFQLKACDFCDDVFAETADVVFGDAWLPQYDDEWRGTNVVVVRNEAIELILSEGSLGSEVDLVQLSVEDAVRSQAGNFRHRREGLSLRIEDAVKRGEWVPKKRVKPGQFELSESRKALIRQRQKIGEASHEIFERAKAAGSLDLFMNEIAPMLAKYRKVDAHSKRNMISLVFDPNAWRKLFTLTKAKFKP